MDRTRRRSRVRRSPARDAGVICARRSCRTVTKDLYRCDSPTSPCLTHVATHKGGYGTIGEAVVTAVPLEALGLKNGGKLSDVEAFTAVGSYLTGATQILDSVRLSR